MSKFDFDSNKKQRYIAGALVVALCLGGSYGCSRCSKTDIPEDALASELVSDDEVIPPTNLILQSDDFVKSSCPVISHITGKTMDNEDEIGRASCRERVSSPV